MEAKIEAALERTNQYLHDCLFTHPRTADIIRIIFSDSPAYQEMARELDQPLKNPKDALPLIWVVPFDRFLAIEMVRIFIQLRHFNLRTMPAAELDLHLKHYLGSQSFLVQLISTMRHSDDYWSGERYMPIGEERPPFFRKKNFHENIQAVAEAYEESEQVRRDYQHELLPRAWELKQILDQNAPPA